MITTQEAWSIKKSYEALYREYCNLAEIVYMYSNHEQDEALDNAMSELIKFNMMIEEITEKG